jgi:hypothetical protein
MQMAPGILAINSMRKPENGGRQTSPRWREQYAHGRMTAPTKSSTTTRGLGTGGATDRATGGAFGHGIEENIRVLYRFIVYNYEPIDELYFLASVEVHSPSAVLPAS